MFQNTLYDNMKERIADNKVIKKLRNIFFIVFWTSTISPIYLRALFIAFQGDADKAIMTWEQDKTCKI